MGRLLNFIASFSSKRPKTVLVLVGVMIALAALVLFSIPFEGNIKRLVPSHAEKTSLYFDLMETFGTMELMYIVFTSDNIDSHLGEIDKIGAELTAAGLVRDVEWKLTEQTKDYFRNTFFRKAPLFLSEDEMREFKSRLTPGGMEAEFEKLGIKLSLPGASMAGLDPLDLLPIFMSHMKTSDISFDITSGYYVTEDGKCLIMMANPIKRPQDIDFSEKLIKTTREILDRHSGNGLRADITGNHAMTYYEASIMKKDMARNIVSSFVCVLLIFFIFFKGLRGFAVSIIPVALAIVLSAATVGFFVGSITEVTGAFAGLLIGLGMDIGIVLYMLYVTQVVAGGDEESSLRGSVLGAGPGITIAILTTCVTFFPMALSSFGGIRELGLLTGVGMVFTWLLQFLLFPVVGRKGRVAGHRLAFVGHVFSAAYSRPKIVIFAVAVITVLALTRVDDINLMEDVRKLGAKKNPASEVFRMLDKEYMKKSNIVIVAEAKTPDEAAARSASIIGSLNGGLENALSVASFLPPSGRQERNLLELAKIDADSVVKTFYKKADEAGLRPEMFDEYAQDLKASLENREPIKYEELDTIKPLIERFIRKVDGGYKYIISGSLRKDTPPPPDLQYTGPEYVRKELITLLKNDAIKITLIGLVLVNIILFIDYRSLSFMLLAQVPVFVAVIWVLGAMGAFGIDLNFMNAIVFVMLFGIGTDYTIHMIHRYKDTGDVSAVSAQTAPAVVMAALTTVAGFGTMAFSSYRGLSSMGLVTAIGVAACVILTLTLIPAYLKVHEAVNNRK